MKLYIKQKVFSWSDKFRIYDADGHDLYSVQGEVFSLGKKLHVYGPDGQELAFIHQKLMSLMPRYFISRDGKDVAEVAQKLTFLHPKYIVEGLGWDITGDILAHDYQITANGQNVVVLSKQWFAWGDTYEIDVANGTDEVLALCVVLAVDATIAAGSSSSI